MQIQGHGNAVKIIFGKQLFQNTQRNYDFRPKEGRATYFSAVSTFSSDSTVKTYT